jgi:hypothetical protein
MSHDELKQRIREIRERVANASPGWWHQKYLDLDHVAFIVNVCQDLPALYTRGDGEHDRTDAGAAK